VLSGKRLLITGVTGKAVLPIARALATRNEVFGLARLASEEARSNLRRCGIIPCPVDLEDPDLSGVPTDTDYLLHFAWTRAGLEQLDLAIRVNVEAAGLIFRHCRSAQAALVVSSQGIYAANDDPMHAYTEEDAIGCGATPWTPTSPATKLGLEAVARFCGRAYDLPMTIARLNTVLGPRKAYFATHFDAVREGREIVLPGYPNPHSPIHTDDMILQIEPLLAAANTRATIVNWCGDEVITVKDTLARTSEILGKPARVRLLNDPRMAMGLANDPAKRLAITGPCTVPFWEGFDRMASAISAEPKFADYAAKGAATTGSAETTREQQKS
jgi:nucleoside-diphosphate-sugar epimerase